MMNAQFVEPMLLCMQILLRNQSPLPLKVGNVVEVLHDGGTGWARCQDSGVQSNWLHSFLLSSTNQAM